MAKKVPPSCDPSSRPLSPAVIGERVRVHLNLHNGCYVASVRGKVVGYTHGLILSDVTSNVSQSGYRRCREEGVRNVHAWIDGYVVDIEAPRSAPSGFKQISYNCLTSPPCFFYRDDGACFVAAEMAYCLPGGRVFVAPRMRLNMDERRRDAERRAAYGSPQGQAEALAARVRSGEIALWRVRLASFLGDPVAALVAPVTLPEVELVAPSHPPASRRAEELSVAIQAIVPPADLPFPSQRVQAWRVAGLAVMTAILHAVYDPAMAAIRAIVPDATFFNEQDPTYTIPWSVVQRLTSSAMVPVSGHLALPQGDWPAEAIEDLNLQVGTINLPDEFSEQTRDDAIDSLNMFMRFIGLMESRPIGDQDRIARNSFERLASIAEDVLRRRFDLVAGPGCETCDYSGAANVGGQCEWCGPNNPRWRADLLQGAWSRLLIDWALRG